MVRCLFLQLAVLLSLGAMADRIGLSQEPLSMKVEWRHGKYGPRRTFTKAAPGETVRLFADIRGLKASESGQLKVKIQAQLRSEENDLLKILMNEEYKLDNALGSGRLPISLSITIPLEYAGKKVRIVHSIKDLNSDQEITHDFPIEIFQPIGAYPVNAHFTHVLDGPSGSGRFTVGERVFIQFDLLGLEGIKKAHSKLTVIPSGTLKSALDYTLPVDVPDVRNVKDGLTVDFDFLATQPFEGIVRLSVTDDAGNCNSIELPLVVTEALGIEQAGEIASKPDNSGEKPKRLPKNLPEQVRFPSFSSLPSQLFVSL